MNFFESQERARKRTFSLVLYFVLALILIILSIVALIMAVIIYFNQALYITEYGYGNSLNIPTVTGLFIQTATLVSPVIIFVILIGTILKIFSLRNGGVALAEMVKATPLSPDTKDFLEKRFLNVVEEMSIASGVSIPKLYVMNDEAGINAFVAGIKPQDTVMVVTRGALEQLTRDELQGVVGHEFSHIFNSDMQISLRLIGILAGLLVIGQLGYFLIRVISNSGRGRRQQSDGRIYLAVLFVGIGLLVIGYLGIFFGRLIKAAISRQREILADASSVQYTRNPQGIINALRRIQQYETGSRLDTKNVEDLSHMLFGSPRWVLFSNLLSTHPPLEQRIKMLDPNGQYRNLPLSDIKSSEAKKTTPKKTKASLESVMPAILAATISQTIPVQSLKQSIGNLTDDHIALAKKLIASIPQNLKDLAHNPQEVQKLLYGLIIQSNFQLASLKEILEKGMKKEELEQVITYAQNIAALPKSLQLPLIDITIPAFKAKSLPERQQIFNVMHQLSKQIKCTIFEYALLTFVEKASTAQNKTKAIYDSFNPVITEISTLLWIIISKNDGSDPQRIELYNKTMKNFASQFPQASTLSTNIKVHDTLTKLNQLSPLCKEKLIQACLDSISEDGKINVTEAQWIRAVAASLECPIPPILPSN